jgi:hypothetical protein
VVIRAQTADGAWFYCDSICVSGWVPAKRIAVCADRREWWTAQRFPAEDALVVTVGKLYLDAANVNAAASQRMLTMGTVLRRVPGDAYDPAVTNRAAYQNYAVYLPAQGDDGGYAETIALIPRRGDVHEGYLPLTTRNVLNTAFSMLGDAYGWGGMLGVPDCSLYIRHIYSCFGLELRSGLDLEISKEDALDYGFAAMNHAMCLTGVNLVDGKPNRWKIENSWGDENGKKGYYVCSDTWFDRYVFQAAIEKEYLGDLAALAEQEPAVLEPWDPMGTLAD